VPEWSAKSWSEETRTFSSLLAGAEREKDAGDHYNGMHRVQTAQLYDYEKQKEHDREVGEKKILSFLWGT
jgi:hypothetical protein